MTKITDRREGGNKKKGMVVSIIVNLLIVMGLGLAIGKNTEDPAPPKKIMQIELFVAEKKGVDKSKKATAKKKFAPKKQDKKPLVKKIKPTAEKVDEVLTTPLEKEAKVAVAPKEEKNIAQEETTVLEIKGTVRGKLFSLGKGFGAKPTEGLGADRAIVKRCGDFLRAAKAIQADGEVVFIIDVDAAGNVVAIKQKSSSIDSGALIARTSECVSNYKYTPKAGASIQRGLVTVSYKYR
jgi:outer membrane biosynthesis protein TonB